jgi:hypothetical protein
LRLRHGYGYGNRNRYRYALLKEFKKTMCNYLSTLLFLKCNEMNSNLLNNSLEKDLEQELALDKVAVLEQGMVEEQVQVCTIERIKKNNV